MNLFIKEFSYFFLLKSRNTGTADPILSKKIIKLKCDSFLHIFFPFYTWHYFW